MKELLSAHLPSLGMAATIAGFIIAVTRWASATLSEDVLLRMSLWILGDAGTDKADTILTPLFLRVAGPHLSWKRLAVILIANLCVGSSAYFWYNIFVLSESSNGWTWAPDVNIDMWFAFCQLLLLASVPVQIATFWTTDLLLLKLLRRVSSFRILAFIVSEMGILLFVDTAWISAILLGYDLERHGIVAGRFLTMYADFIADNFFVINFGAPLYFTKYIFSLVWISVALVFLFFKILNSGGSKVASWISIFIRRKKVEEEPIALLGEFVAALVFISIVAYAFSFSSTVPANIYPS
jgi:hypothetical protein